MTSLLSIYLGRVKGHPKSIIPQRNVGASQILVLLPRKTRLSNNHMERVRQMAAQPRTVILFFYRTASDGAGAIRPATTGGRRGNSTITFCYSDKITRLLLCCPHFFFFFLFYLVFCYISLYLHVFCFLSSQLFFCEKFRFLSVLSCGLKI